MRGMEHPADATADGMNCPQPAARSDAPIRRQRRSTAIFAGAIIGVLSTFAMVQFKLEGGTSHISLILGAVAGALIGLSRARRLLWWWGGLAVAWILLVAFTPLAHWVVKHTDRTDHRGPADAVIVLGCGMMADETPSSSAEDRLLQAAQIVREGDTHTVVLCGVLWRPSVIQQLHWWGADATVLWSGPVGNTHDEALATARLARANGWQKVIVVTQAWHMRRAAAVFRSAGLEVLQSPAAETRYDMESPDQLMDRFQAVRDWLHESIGYRIYRYRGWIH
jgi:uncharacterized SAM-binding protein YcdF (DUF218 family)